MNKNMYILKTQLLNFRFNSIIQLGPVRVRLYKLVKEDEEVEGNCLTYEELNQLTSFVVSNKVNFGNSNYHVSDPDDAPYMSEYDLAPISNGFPKYLVIHPENKINLSPEGLYKWMDIELLNTNSTRNDISTLPFGLICKVEI